jgi:hypothetical protein
MLRPANGDPTVPESLLEGRTNILDLDGRGVWRRALILVTAVALFGVAFLGAYRIGQDPSTPAAPPQSTWRGTAVTTVPITAPNVVDPIDPAAALPPLRVATTGAVASFSQQQRRPISPESTIVSTVTTSQKTTKTPSSKTTTTPGPPKLITVTN